MILTAEAAKELLKSDVKNYCDSTDLLIPQGVIFDRHCEFYADQIEVIDLPDIDADKGYTLEAEQAALNVIFSIAIECVKDWRNDR